MNDIPVPDIGVCVWVRAQFVGFHRWKDAPESVGFLRDFHRHVFHVKLGVPVGGLNREVEFFTLKAELEAFLISHYQDLYFEESCEMIASFILARFKGEFVEVSEDGENGALVFANKKKEN